MFRMLRCFAAVLAALILMGCAARSWAAEPSYDVVIRHGKIVDGTGNPWFYGDVAIRGERHRRRRPSTGWDGQARDRRHAV